MSRREFLRVSAVTVGGLALSQVPDLGVVEASPLVERENGLSRVLGFYLPFHELPNDKAMMAFKQLVLDSRANTVVVDIKNEAGLINIPFEHPLKSKMKSPVEDYKYLESFLTWAEANQILIIGRQVVMEDARLVWANPSLGVKTRDGKIWQGGGRIWANPFDERVVEYNAAFAETAAALGIKVIQYDYVRFPADGEIKTIWHSKSNTRENRVNAITAFFAAAKPRVEQYGALLGADFFGYTAYPDYKDMGIGQLIEAAGPHLHFISPMAYPSLYGGGIVEDVCGVKKCTPASAYPYEILYYTVMHTLERLAKVNPEAFVLPWIQAYPDGRYGKPMKLPQFEAQQEGAFDAGAAGVVAWNPSLKYHPEFYHSIYRNEDEEQAGPGF